MDYMSGHVITNVNLCNKVQQTFCFLEIAGSFYTRCCYYITLYIRQGGNIVSTVQQQYYIADCLILGYKQGIAYLGFVEGVSSQKLIDIFI